jgi:glycosyltransferase involved in cell wall biosynthesis
MTVYFPLVSVIIPAYNAEAFITQTLESVLAQTYQNLEVLVVDDGSRDTTPEIVQSFAQRDRRIQLLQQANAGVAIARNLGIQKAKGELIAPLDADDIWYPQKLEKQVNVFAESDESVGLVYAWSVYLDEEGRRMQACQVSEVEGNAYIPLTYGNFPGNASSVLIRRSCFDRVGGYDASYHARKAQGCEDWDLYLRIAEHYEFRLVPELLVGYRQVIGSMSFNHAAMKKSCDLLLDSVYQKCPQLSPRLYQWASSNFSWYLALRCMQSGDHLSAIAYLYQAAKLDFLPLLRPGFYRLLLKSYLKQVARPVTTRIWPTHRDWIEFQQRLYTRYQEPKLAILQRQRTRALKRFPWKQYMDVLRWRWSVLDREYQAVSQSEQLLSPAIRE